MASKSKQIRLYQILEHRFPWAAVPAMLLPILGTAGFHLMGHGQPPPRVALASITPAPLTPAVSTFEEFTDKFRKNETITAALMRHGLTRKQVLSMVEAARPVWPRTVVKAEADFEGNLYRNGDFHEFRYRLNADRYITIYREGDRFVPLVKKFDYETRTEAVSGVIEDSLSQAVIDAGEREQLAVNLADVFQWDVDFYTDIHKGDSFRILVEKKYLNGTFERYGNILAADLTVGKKRCSAFSFDKQLYDANGKSLRKALLKSPLKFVARVTSRFSNARRHPILKIVRPHLGVDYAAPIGAPVVAVASGRVVSAGWNGGFGKSVHLRHPNGLETIYSHLSRISVHAGEQVMQGERIGDVGATGLATGPHLDFRVIQSGRFIDPSKKIVPDALPVAASAFARFAERRDGLRHQMDLLTHADSLARSGISASSGGQGSKYAGPARFP